MNILSDTEGWQQFYNVTILRSCGDYQTFPNLEGRKVVEIVSLCLTIDDPYARIEVTPIKLKVTH
jgi:hypothetical protein